MSPVPPVAFSSNADDRPPRPATPIPTPDLLGLQEPAQSAHPASSASPRGPDAPDAPSTDSQVPILDLVRTHLQTYVSAPDDDALRFVVLLGWAGDKVVSIRDFHYAPYIADGLAVQPL